MRHDQTTTANTGVRTLTHAEILAVSGGKDGDGNESGTGRGDGLGKLRGALGGGLLGEIATVLVQTGRGIGRALPF